MFQLSQDEDDYPPFDSEQLWAFPYSGAQQLWSLDNTPFFANQATLGDVVGHYDSVLQLRLAPDQKSDLVEFLKSL